MARKSRIGVMGCGDISGRYLANFTRFPNLEVVACADVRAEAAAARGREFGVPRACTPEELLAARDVDIVVNLTPPKAHYTVSAAALEAGKHVYTEKPLASERAEGRRLLDLAKSRSLAIGCAPDTFLGAGLQTCLRLVTEGWIGRPIAASAFMMRSPPEASSPNVAFIYERNLGPLFDMGPYYLTALVLLLGPLRRVTSSAQVTSRERVITVAPNAGKRFTPETATYVAGALDFRGGAVATLVTTFDVWASTLPHIELYGTEGTLLLPDPNTFGGPVRLRRANSEEWHTMPLSHRYSTESRGLGVAEMAHALQSGGGAFRMRAELGYHILEAMHGLLASSESGRHHEMESSCEPPPPLPVRLVEGMADGLPGF